MLARQADVNVLPVGISEPEGHFRVNKLRRITIEVNVGQPIPANSVDVNELIQSAHDEVAVLFNRTKSLK